MDWINLSTHAVKRWHERTDSPGVGPRYAWDEAKKVENVPGVYGDEFRYHSATGTIMIRKGNTLATVIRTIPGSRRVKQIQKGVRAD